MSRVNAVTAVTGKLFEEDWGKVGRGRNIGHARHMARAAQGASPAVFKMIRTGGCSSPSQLSAQFNYLFSKSVDIHGTRHLLVIISATFYDVRVGDSRPILPERKHIKRYEHARCQKLRD